MCRFISFTMCGSVFNATHYIKSKILFLIFHQIELLVSAQDFHRNSLLFDIYLILSVDLISCANWSDILPKDVFYENTASIVTGNIASTTIIRDGRHLRKTLAGEIATPLSSRHNKKRKEKRNIYRAAHERIPLYHLILLKH